MRSQLNQVRAWVQQGRTDAWIAHQLDVSASELRDFIRRNDLSADEGASDDVDLRDEIEAEIEARMEAEEDEPEDEDDEDEGDEQEGEGDEKERDGGAQVDDEGSENGDEGDGEGDGEGAAGGRRRRRRRRRGPKRAGAGLEATFDHGDDEGFGLWLDPVVETDPVYAEHWKGHRKLEVTIEPDQIIIRRAE